MLTRFGVTALPVGLNRSTESGRSAAAIAALGVLAGLVLAGCGGSHSTTTTTAATTTAATTTTKSSVTQTTPVALPPLVAPRHHVTLGKTSYETTMQKLGKTLALSVEGMFPLVDGSPGTQAAAGALTKVEKTRTVVTQIRTELAGIVAPAPVRKDHQHLVASLGDLLGELDTLIGVLQHGGSKPFGSYTVFGALNTVALITSDMKKKGYAVG